MGRQQGRCTWSRPAVKRSNLPLISGPGGKTRSSQGKVASTPRPEPKARNGSVQESNRSERKSKRVNKVTKQKGAREEGTVERPELVRGHIGQELACLPDLRVGGSEILHQKKRVAKQHRRRRRGDRELVDVATATRGRRRKSELSFVDWAKRGKRWDPVGANRIHTIARRGEDKADSGRKRVF